MFFNKPNILFASAPIVIYTFLMSCFIELNIHLSYILTCFGVLITETLFVMSFPDSIKI